MNKALLEDIIKDNKDIKTLIKDQKILIIALEQQIKML